MIIEFYKDLKSYYKNSKWMRFEFYFRQPFSLLVLLIMTIITMIMAHDRPEKITAIVLAIFFLIGLMLLLLIYARKKCSYCSLIVLLIIQEISIPIVGDFSFWSIAFAIVFLTLLIIYYRKRKDFFNKESSENGINKKSIVIGSVLGGLMVFLLIVLGINIAALNYNEKSAKVISYITDEIQDEWTTEQTKETAERWINAVEEKNFTEIQTIIESMIIEQEQELEDSFFFKKTVFKAGIDRKKCNAVLAFIDAEEQGLAYYSLVRIGNYYDEQRNGNHELETEVAENGEGIYVTFRHGKSEIELAFTDMNEIVGEEGKCYLHQMNFSDEQIVSMLSSIYVDEDISFVSELAKASGTGEYVQILRNDPDKLSAYAQDALYSYVYQLASNGFEYDSRLCITEQNFEGLESIMNQILLMPREDKQEDYSKRYLKILEDEGKYHMNVAAEQLRQNYDKKELVIYLIPEFIQNVQLYTLFDDLLCRLDEINNLKDTMRVEELGLYYIFVGEEGSSSLLIDGFGYREIVENNGRKLETDIMLKKYTGNETLLLKERLDSDTTVEEDLWIALYGDAIVCDATGDKEETVIIMQGVHDANAILKAEWMKNKGLSCFTSETTGDEIKKEIENLILNASSESETDNAVDMYLLWEGKNYGNSYRKITDMKAAEINNYIRILENMTKDWGEEFKYIQYSIIDDYYLTEKENFYE